MSSPMSSQLTPNRSGAGVVTKGRHRVHIGHLVMGVALLGLLVVWALVEGDTVDGKAIRFLLPVPWVLAGLVGLAALLRGERRRPHHQQTGWIGKDPVPEPADGRTGAQPEESDTDESDTMGS